jgi:hypothetical protein
MYREHCHAAKDRIEPGRRYSTLSNAAASIKLAHCMAINKAQGQSLSRVGIHLVDDVFGHGQLYAAVSRFLLISIISYYTAFSDFSKKLQYFSNYFNITCH